MLSDHGLALVSDTSRLPQIDLTGLDTEDRLVVQTRMGLYELMLEVLNVYNEPPVWVAQARGSGLLKPDAYALIGANTNYHHLALGTEIKLASLQFNLLIQGFPMVLGTMHDGCVVLGPIEHLWLNASRQF